MSKTQRPQPRFNAELPVQLLVESAGTQYRFSVQSVNISLRSMQVEGDQSVMDAFLAQDSCPHICEVKFSVPGDKQPIQATCQMVSHRRLSQRSFYLALGFTAFEGEGRQQLENYLLCLRPDGFDRLIVPEIPYLQGSRA